MDAGSSSPLELPQQFRQFTISEIHLATQNFDESLIIGRGGFGTVYKGTFTNRASNLVVAVKRLDSTSNQGAAEFWNEVQMLSQLRHCHLVSLIGYCNDGQEMILLYEYMPHGTLEDHLHKLQSSLPWVRRLKICIGAARGLDYLHTGTGITHGIIHRDVKSSNILLDDNWAAKISDFGLSKLGPINQPSTYVQTLVKGTFGYLDPDYYATGRLTRKSDVYAIGVVLFEVLSGKQAVDRSLDEEHWGLVNWAQESVKEGRLKQIVGGDIRGGILPKCLKEFGRLAVRCLHSNPKQRPTMAEVVIGLESVLALQEKANYTPAGMKIFGNKVPMFLSSYKSELTRTDEITPKLQTILEDKQGLTKTDEITPKLQTILEDKQVGSTSSLELYFDTINGENSILHKFEFETINVATDNFSNNNKISFFGSMYKGRLQNGQGVSISRHDSKFQGDTYKDEVSLMVKLDHENLLKLLGYSIKGTQLFLVYEFPLSTSLDRLIHDNECTLLDWNRRNKILLGVARALLYLHLHAPFRIIHGDVKPENILLDESLDPKLSDFGFARYLAINEADCIEVDTVCETFGYIVPEYMAKLSLSTKADVDSFGVLILQTITGCTIWNYYSRNLRVNMNFEQYVWTNWAEGTSLDIIDPRICDAHPSSITNVIHIGLLCVQPDPADRPTMEEVVAMLTDTSSLLLPLPIPKKPTAIPKISRGS